MSTAGIDQSVPSSPHFHACPLLTGVPRAGGPNSRTNSRACCRLSHSLRYEDGSFDAVVDKGTLDALMSEDTPEVVESGKAMLREVKRVLKPGGR